MEINNRIKELIEDILNISPYEFSKSIGNERPDGLYKILKGEVSPSPKTLNKIFEKYPQYKVWIMTGEGARNISGNTTINNGGNNKVIMGDNNEVRHISQSEELVLLRQENEHQRKYIEQLQKNIELLEKLLQK